LTPTGCRALLERLVLLHAAAVHFVPDVEQLLAGAAQARGGQGVLVALLAQLQDRVQPLGVHVLRDGVVLDPLADLRHVLVGQVEPAERPALLVVLLHHPQAADGEQLLAPQVQLTRGHELLLRLQLEVLGQRLAQLRRLLRRALLEDLLLVGADRLDLLEQPVPLLGQQDLLLTQCLPVELAERLLAGEQFVDQSHEMSEPSARR